MIKIYSYESNVKYNNGVKIDILGTTKASIEKAFKMYCVKVGKRKREIIIENTNRYKDVDEIYKQQINMLIKLLKTKKIYIEETKNNGK